MRLSLGERSQMTHTSNPPLNTLCYVLLGPCFRTHFSLNAMTSVHLICSISSTVCRRKELPPGSPLFLLSNMAGFVLHKGAFTDALCLHYGWTPPRLPSHCVCGSDFSISHAFSCPHRAFPTIRHNSIHDFTASLLSEVCHDVKVKVEHYLQPPT